MQSDGLKKGGGRDANQYIISYYTNVQCNHHDHLFDQGCQACFWLFFVGRVKKMFFLFLIIHSNWLFKSEMTIYLIISFFELDIALLVKMLHRKKESIVYK